LQRLNTDYIDIYFMHGFDALTPMDETLSALDNLIRSGKIRYIGCSNFSGWQVMKALSVAEKHHFARYVVYQGYYSLIGRDYEWELMPLGLDQGLSLMVWSPLGWARLTGKIRRGQPPAPGRLQAGGAVGGPHIPDESLYQVIDVMDVIAKETGKTLSQIAINWLLQRPTVCNVIIGARNEAQLKQNLGATDWHLSPDQMNRLDEVSRRPLTYPYWHQADFDDINPKPVRW
jgi:aryl-alcohol dehydrogenase-like predicted oxidoreductase